MNLRRAFAASLMAAVLTIVVGSPVRGQEKAATLKGYVLDSACAFVKNLKKPVSRECALKCAKAGSPLVILADDGTIYWPISDSVPATGQNQRLMKFAGQRVTLSGRVFERGGSRAIVIERVEIETTGK